MNSSSDRYIKEKNMDQFAWLNRYFSAYAKTILDKKVHADLISICDEIRKVKKNGRKVIFAGNGGSAAMSSHCAVDFTKIGKVRSVNFNESDLITCFANDYGYENWLKKALQFYADDGDLVVLISSSGKSPNMVNAARYAKNRKLRTITLTGFSSENPLKKLGDINLWVDSGVYNVVENTHQSWLLGICDLLTASDKKK